MVEGGHCLKTLTRRAAGQQVKLATANFEPPHYRGGRDVPDVILPNNHLFVVGFVGFNRKGIYLDCGSNAKTGLLQS